MVYESCVRENGDKDISRIEVVETGGQIKMQKRNMAHVKDLTLIGGKKSAGTKLVRPVMRARLSCPVARVAADNGGAKKWRCQRAG